MITIAIPFYNADKFLEFAIQSVLRQTYTNWKLILLDDGSTDNSLNIAKKYESIDSRIKVYSDGLNKNLPLRLNEITNIANTKYLARMDADDIMHPDRLQKQFSVLENNPQIDILGTNAYIIDKNNTVIGVRFNFDYNQQIIKVSSFIHPTIIGKTEWFKKNLYNPEAIRMEDYELWQRTRKQNNFMMITEPLLFYREYGNKYYIKYYKSIKGFFNMFICTFNIRYLIKSIITIVQTIVYFLFHVFGKESKLIYRRNQIRFKNQITIQKILEIKIKV